MHSKISDLTLAQTKYVLQITINNSLLIKTFFTFIFHTFWDSFYCFVLSYLLPSFTTDFNHIHPLLQPTPPYLGIRPHSLTGSLSPCPNYFFLPPPSTNKKSTSHRPGESLWPRAPFLYLYINIMIGWNFFLLSLFKVSKTRFSSNIVKTCPLHPLVPSSTKHSISRYTRVSYYAVCL